MKITQKYLKNNPDILVHLPFGIVFFFFTGQALHLTSAFRDPSLRPFGVAVVAPISWVGHIRHMKSMDDLEMEKYGY